MLHTNDFSNCLVDMLSGFNHLRYLSCFYNHLICGFFGVNLFEISNLVVQSNVDYLDLLGDVKNVWVMENMNINEDACEFAYHA